MKALERTLCVFLPVMLSACELGPQIATMAAPRQPGGATVVVAVNASGQRQRAEYEGELVAVRDDGAIVALHSDAGPKPRLTLLPWQLVAAITATQLPGFKAQSEAGGAPRDSQMEKMRLVSRYPQGVSSALMVELLAAYQQESLDTLEAR